MQTLSEILTWLLEGDPAIRWQVLQDLVDATPADVAIERQRIASEGWGARLLALQDPDGRWASGLYSPKWTSTTYTLLLLRQFGLPGDNPQAQRGCAHFLARGINHDGGINLFHTIDYSETCVNGMLLALLSYFGARQLEVLRSVVGYILGEQMVDGGWNCERIKGATHASFHTTLSVLEGLHEYRQFDAQADPAIQGAVERAHGFLLAHRLYHSHRTGKVADPAMARIYFPPRWRYDYLRALDYFRSAGAAWDGRMQDGTDLLLAKRKKEGCWNQGSNWAGRTFFDLEPIGAPGRWNTLRALRVLKFYAPGWWKSEVARS